MTPERRLDQLEPLMADALQKIDRLIEGQGKILDIAAHADLNASAAAEKAEDAAKMAEIAAKGVANLTISTQKQFDSTQKQFDELKAGQRMIMDYLREKLP